MNQSTGTEPKWTGLFARQVGTPVAGKALIEVYCLRHAPSDVLIANQRVMDGPHPLPDGLACDDCEAGR